MAPRAGASAPNIVEFVTDAQLLGLTLSAAQATLLRAIYGLPLSETQVACFRGCTGREPPPAAGGFGEVTVVAGARAGKDSRIAAPIVCYEALFGGHERHLAKASAGCSRWSRRTRAPRGSPSGTSRTTCWARRCSRGKWPATRWPPRSG